MELLALEMVHHYQNQSRLPAAAAIEAIGGMGLLGIYFCVMVLTKTCTESC